VSSNQIVPLAQGSLFTFRFDDTVFSVDARRGGRIVTFSLGGRNILIGPAVEPANYGSTFWSSPQSDWGWPPPVEIDSAPYASRVDGATLELVGQVSPTLGLGAEKRFSADPHTGVVTVAYTIRNHGPQARQVAPWEISRVAAGGLTFFPMGEGEIRKGMQDLLRPSIRDGVVWFAYDASVIGADQKLFADGHEGWIAHVDGDLLLVKSFPDTLPHQAAPGEGEIEIYANAGHTYVEVENQGAFVTLHSGQASTWTVHWMLRRLDLGATPAKPGSAALVSFVRGLVKKARGTSP